MIFGSILELVGIGSIPIFCMIILDTEILIRNSHGLVTSDFIEDIGEKKLYLNFVDIINFNIFI